MLIDLFQSVLQARKSTFDPLLGLTHGANVGKVPAVELVEEDVVLELHVLLNRETFFLVLYL